MTIIVTAMRGDLMPRSRIKLACLAQAYTSFKRLRSLYSDRSISERTRRDGVINVPGGIDARFDGVRQASDVWSTITDDALLVAQHISSSGRRNEI